MLPRYDLSQGEAPEPGDGGNGFMAGVLTFLSMLFIVLTFPITIWFCFKMVQVSGSVCVRVCVCVCVFLYFHLTLAATLYVV